MFHERFFPFSSNDHTNYTALIPLPSIPPLSYVFLDPTTSSLVSTDFIVQFHHDFDEDIQDFPDALNNPIS